MRASIRQKLLLSDTGSQNTTLAELLDITAPGMPGLEVSNGNLRLRVDAVPDDHIDDNKILGLNARRAWEKVREAGSAIQQQAENIKNQTNLYTVSDTQNFAKLDNYAVKVLNLA